MDKEKLTGKRLSVVSTLYFSEQTLEALYKRICLIENKIELDVFEFIFVDDGSPDNSLGVAKNLCSKDRRVTVIEFSRNFGHHAAMIAGLEKASGDYIFLIDSDLEEEPEWLLTFYEKLKLGNLDAVYGRQISRRGNMIARFAGWAYYSSFRFLTGINQPNNITTCRLMTRKYLNGLLLYQENKISIGGLWIDAGFRQEAVGVKKHSSSPSTYTFLSRSSLALTAVTAYSSKPLYINFIFSIFIILASIGLALYYMIQFFLNDVTLDGFTTLALLILISLGINSLNSGINSLYLATVFIETKKRPRYIIRNIHSKEQED